VYVYLAGIDPVKGVPALHFIRCAPAAHLGVKHAYSDWVEKVDGKLVGKEFTVDFLHGKADVPDKLGEYLIEHNFAQAERWQPPRTPWEG
jgi:hypothetical protein